MPEKTEMTVEAEQQRLLDTLKYYAWLETVGLSWDMIQGIREITKHKAGDYIVRRANWKLKDGSTKTTGWPPFDDDVIFNRSRLEN